MLPEEPSGEGFTVRDRRRQPAEAEPVGPSERGAPAAAELPPSHARPGEAASGTPGMLPEPSLAALFLLLAESALFHLGEGPPGRGEPAVVDLAQAQFSIELLRVLQEKTEGRRSAEESQLLEALLYDLEMRFVRAVGSR